MDPCSCVMGLVPSRGGGLVALCIIRFYMRLMDRLRLEINIFFLVYVHII